MTFIDTFKNKHCTEKDLEDFILDWHNSKSSLKIEEVLGVSKEEYLKWLMREDSFENVFLSKLT